MKKSTNMKNKRMQFFKQFLIGLSPLLVATPIIVTSCRNATTETEYDRFKVRPDESLTPEIPYHKDRDLTRKEVGDWYKNKYHRNFENENPDVISNTLREQQEIQRLNIDLKSNTKYQLNPQYDKKPNYKMLDLLNKDPNNLSKEEFWYLVFHKFGSFESFIEKYNELVFFNYEGGLNGDYKQIDIKPVITNDVEKKDEILELHNLMNEVYNESQKDTSYTTDDKELIVNNELQQKVFQWLKDHNYLQNQIEDFTNIFKNIKFRVVDNEFIGKLIEIEVEADVFYKGRNLNEIYDIYDIEKYNKEITKYDLYKKEDVIKSRSYTWKLPVRALIDKINNKSFTPTYENVIHVLSVDKATFGGRRKLDQEEYNKSVAYYQTKYSLPSLLSQYEEDLVTIYGNFGRYDKSDRQLISKNEKFINHKSKLQLKEEKQKELEKEREDY